MAYSYITWLQLRQALSARLDDVNQVFWIDDEIKIILIEALRTWGVLSAFWRERGTFNTVSGVTFYDVPASITAGLLNYTVTDYDVIKAMQYHLLESASSQNVWSGTEMFDLDDLSTAIERRINQFLQDTGIVVTHTDSISVTGERVTLPDNTIDIRRLVYVDSDGRFYRLFREDELAASYYQISWPQDTGTPSIYSVLDARPLEVQLSPPPLLTGTLEMLSVNSHAALSPAAGSTILQLFDDLIPFIKWGALADCLGFDGPARDPIRANYCEQRYQQGVEFTKLLGLVVQARINDQVVIPTTISDLDTYTVSWENKIAAPVDLGLASWNLLAASPTPNGVYSITLDVIRKAIIPQDDGDFVQIGREQVNAILDYAENIALFKVGGQEFLATIRQADDFLIESATYNRRLSAQARYIVTSKGTSQKESSVNPYELQTQGLGAGPGDMRNARSSSR